jgi:phenylpropionate dioxygenase-like ring-hydroxylating dioxygenase large terminal subunit
MSAPLFHCNERFVRTWYWLLRSDELRPGDVTAIRLLGRDLVVFRSESGLVRAMDAHCPHMGAHLAEGRVDGEGIRCFFHGWKLDERGAVSDVPCRAPPPRAATRAYPVREAYGLIWIWPGDRPTHELPFIAELAGVEVVARLGRSFVLGCHPNVVMINAIDEQHFATVHQLPVELSFAVEAVGAQAQRFSNCAPLEPTTWFRRLVRRFYASAVVRYDLTYFGGTVGTATVGPDSLHCHLMFALRPDEHGRTEGTMVMLQPRRRGLGGWLLTQLGLFLAARVGDHFGVGDRQVFASIRFDLATPLPEDRSVVAFIDFVNQQPAAWRGSWRSA